MINDEYILNKYLNKKKQINSLRFKNITKDNKNNNLSELIYRIKNKLKQYLNETE